MLSQKDKQLKSLVNKYLHQEGILLSAKSKQYVLKTEIEKYLKDNNKEEISVTIQKDRPIIVYNRAVYNYIVKDDAANTVRRLAPERFLESIIFSKDIVDIDALKKIIDLGLIDNSVMNEITKIENTFSFGIEISK